MKSIPTAKHSPRGGFWYMETSSLSPSTLQTLTSSGFSVADGVLTRLAELTRPLEANNDIPLPEKLPLYPFQEEIARFMITAGSCLNASFVGSGKTLTSLAVCEELRPRRVLIIAPKSVVLQWGQVEILKWLPQAKITVIQGSVRDRIDQYINYDSGYLVIGYEAARADIGLLEPKDFDIIICDEAHCLANPKTKLYKALTKLKSRHRYALTATPIMNKAEDMYGIINWVRPGFLGNYYAFINRYIVKNNWGGVKYYKNMDELAERVRPLIIKKTLEEVGMQLPEYTEEELPVELSPLERKVYDQVKEELLFDIEKAIISKIENPVMLQMSIVKLGKLFELCDSMELIGDNITSSKLEVLKEHLESTLQNGQKAIIITRFARMVDILAKALHQYRPQVITGATNDRQVILNEFSQHAENQLLIGTEAIGQGLNLQVANILYNYDSAWNPAKMEQRAGRIYRNGQTKPVFIYNMVVQKSVEGWLQKKLIKKAELSERLLPQSLSEIKEMLE